VFIFIFISKPSKFSVKKVVKKQNYYMRQKPHGFIFYIALSILFLFW